MQADGEREIIAERRFRYGKLRLKPGDRFPAENKHADLLVHAGSASEIPPEKKPKAAPAAKKQTAAKAEGDGRYARRDMRADP